MKAKKPHTQKGENIVDLTEEQAREYVESLLWPEGAICPHCESKDVYRMMGKTIRAGLFRCRACEKQFTVTVGTIFEDSHLPLRVWVRAFHLMCSSKKGISALQLQRNLGLGSYRTAWHMSHRIRHAMRCEPFAAMLQGTVEVDETYIGGRVTGQGCKAGKSNKTPVVSLVERDGTKRSVVMRHVTGENLRQAIRENVNNCAQVMTDDYYGYRGLHHIYDHRTVKHSAKEYGRKEGNVNVNTNTVESSFALLKRGIVGAFHHVSKKHLSRYCDEFDFRWNNRKTGDVDRTQEAIKSGKGKRLTYKPLTRMNKSE